MLVAIPIIIVATLLCGFLLLYVAQRSIFLLYTRPVRVKSTETPSDQGLKYKELSVSANGCDHPGWLLFPPEGFDPRGSFDLVIVCHGFAADRGDVLQRAASVARSGFVVFTFDWRGHGRHSETECSGGLLERDDLAGIIDYFQNQPWLRSVSLYGFSMGASITILTASEVESVKCVVADAPYDSALKTTKVVVDRFPLGKYWLLQNLISRFKSKFGRELEEIDVEKAAAKLSPRPLLVLTGTNDKLVKHHQSLAVYEAAGEPKQIQIQKGGSHFDNATPELLKDVTIPFLKKNGAPA
jgi:alpha/beta superfamily hydrolase